MFSRYFSYLKINTNRLVDVFPLGFFFYREEARKNKPCSSTANTRSILSTFRSVSTKIFVVRLRFCNWFSEVVYNGEAETLLTFIRSDYLNDHINIQNNGYWSADNPTEYRSFRYMIRKLEFGVLSV